MNKKAYYFSLDAFIALIVILGFVLFIRPSSVQIDEPIRIHEDLIFVLSNLNVGEIDNVFVQNLISQGKITNLNQSVLEQIGEFYANSDPNAELLAQAIIDDLNLRDGIGLYFNGVPIAEAGTTSYSDSDRIWTSRQIISGIINGSSAKGFSSRAFLTSENKVEYFYFGGYVGDGNISILVDGDVLNANMEAVFSGNFDLYINDVFAQSYTPVSGVPYDVDLNSHIDLFVSGENEISLRSNENLYIAGGYLKVVYDTSQNLQSVTTKNFQGIDGLINIYDSFYVPGGLNEMEIFLHYDSPYDIFLTVGNETVYSGNSGSSEATVILDNALLSSVLDYGAMEKKTIPLRLGLKDVNLFGNLSDVFDIFSVTDLSSSMNAQTSSGQKIIDIVREANKEFVEIILNESITENDNRAGLVGYNQKLLPSQESYYYDYSVENYYELSIDETSIDNKIDEWETKAGTCICCGILKATEAFSIESPVNKSKVMVVMSDGVANEACFTNNAKQDAIDAACAAKDDYDIDVYAIGFGDNVDEETLQGIASCGGGNYYYGNVDQLVDIYKQAAQDIIRAIYEEQTVISETIHTILYPDSYIYLDYNKFIPYGLVLSLESSIFGNTISNGSFYVPSDAEPFEVGVVSYSGSRWTDNVEINNNLTGGWENVFRLGDYNATYVNVGDPYIVNIPIEKVVKDTNYVRVSTGLSPTNSSGGSIYDKVIYSIVKDISSYSEIVSSAEGCSWIIEFEDNTNTTMKIPSNYSGSNECYYTDGNVAFNNNDAIDNAIFDLLESLDLDLDRKVDTKFSDQDLTISSVEVVGIPYTWETEVQVRLWR